LKNKVFDILYKFNFVLTIAIDIQNNQQKITYNLTVSQRWLLIKPSSELLQYGKSNQNFGEKHCYFVQVNLKKEANSTVKISFVFYIDKLRHRGNLVQKNKNSEYLIQRKYSWKFFGQI